MKAHISGCSCFLISQCFYCLFNSLFLFPKTQRYHSVLFLLHLFILIYIYQSYICPFENKTSLHMLPVRFFPVFQQIYYNVLSRPGFLLYNAKCLLELLEGFILMSVVNVGKFFMIMSSNISYAPFSLLSLLQYQLHMFLLYIFFCFRLNIFYYSSVQLEPYLLSSLFQMLYLKILKTSIWSVVMNSSFLEKLLIILFIFWNT